MKNHLTDYEVQLLDIRIEQWIERNDHLSNEIKAYKALQELAKDRKGHFGKMCQEEIERRRFFIQELMRDF